MLHYKTVEPATLGLLKSLMAIPELQQFRLVGGTALSLLLFLKINGIKTDFVYTFEPFYSEYQTIDTIRLATIEEIAALKLNAIAGRGAKKDFWDIHRLLKVFSLQQLIDFYQNRYPQNDLMMIIKSFNYFEDAELQADPVSFENINWTTIKKDLNTILKDYLNTQN